MQIANKTFVVTGAGNGIGREVALELLRRGARVAGVDISGAALTETAALAGASDRFSEHAVDLSDRERGAELPDAVAAAHGAVDGLSNVACIIQRVVPVGELSFEDIEPVINVKLWGTRNTTTGCCTLLLA